MHNDFAVSFNEAWGG